MLALLEEKRPQLTAYINRQLGARLKQKVEAEDILQETSLDAVRRVAEFDSLERDPFGWLCQIAEHRLIDAHRRFFQSQKRAGEREVSMDADRNDAGGKFADLLAASMTTPSQAFSGTRRSFTCRSLSRSCQRKRGKCCACGMSMGCRPGRLRTDSERLMARFAFS